MHVYDGQTDTERITLICNKGVTWYKSVNHIFKTIEMERTAREKRNLDILSDSVKKEAALSVSEVYGVYR